MNEIKVSTRAEFNPGAKKPTPARITAVAKVSAFSYGVPKVVSKAPRVLVKAGKPAEFYGGAVKTVPVKTVAKAKVKTTRVIATATAKPRNFVIRKKVTARVTQLPTGILAKPHDIKSAFARASHVPPQATVRNYVTRARSASYASYSRLANTRDRKIATASCVFGSFSARPPSFRWT